MLVHYCHLIWLIFKWLFFPFETFGPINSLNCALSRGTFISFKKQSSLPVNPPVTGANGTFKMILFMQLKPFHVLFLHILYYLYQKKQRKKV